MDKEDRVEEVLALLNSGLTREQIAEQLGIGSSSVDQRMRRGGYHWDSLQEKYVQTESRTVPQRVQRILMEFKSVTADAKQIAVRTGFDDHKAMAEFMRQQGYEWSADKHNYVPLRTQEKVTQNNDTEGTHPEAHNVEPFINWAEFLPLLQYLYENRGRIYNLLDMTPSREMSIPRYGIGGGYRMKSVNIAPVIEDLLKHFSEERGISQREIFEVALVDFFNRYGYRKKLEQWLTG